MFVINLHLQAAIKSWCVSLHKLLPIVPKLDLDLQMSTAALTLKLD